MKRERKRIVIGGRIRLPFLLLLAACAAAGLIAGCELIDPNPGPSPLTGSGGSSSGTTPAADSTPATVERGADLFAQLCARCHGDDASGSPVWPASIQGKIGIHDIVRNGRRAMPGFPTLSDSAIASLEMFLNSFNVDNGNKSGQELFAFYCASCHGDEGLGTNVFPGSIQGYNPIHPLVRNGRGEMLPINIPDSLIVRIQEYLNTYQVDYSTLSGVDYYGRVCAGCHGSAGEGTTRGPEIRNPVTGYARYVVRAGRPGVPWFTDAMPAYTTDSLSDTQLNEIIAWLRTAAKPSDGAALYNRFCANCHGRDARGGPVGKSVLGETGEFLEKVREGEGGNNYSRRKDYMPSWSSGEITNAEVQAMISYVRTLR